MAEPDADAEAMPSPALVVLAEDVALVRAPSWACELDWETRLSPFTALIVDSALAEPPLCD
jgi:hypothetical protein